MRHYPLILLLGFTVHAQYSPGTAIAEIRIPGLDESSGLAASRKHPGVFWSHNDSGGGAWIWAFDRSGKAHGRWKVRKAVNFDWEDIAVGPGPESGISYLYIGDIGDNWRRRQVLTVYRVREPTPDSPQEETAPAERILLEYPYGAHDAEALMVHPRSGDLYLATKARGLDRDTVIWKAEAPLKHAKRTRLRKIAAIRFPESLLSMLIPAGITGGDISPDGTRVVLVDYVKAWEAVLPEGTADFDAIWNTQWRPIETGVRAQGEAVAYRHDGAAFLTTSEGASFPLTEFVRLGP